MSSEHGFSAQGAERPRSKAASIWRRTRTGGVLVAVLALTFWVTDGIGAVWPVFAIGCVLALGVVLEAGRMGRLAGRRWTSIGVIALVATAAVWLAREPLLGSGHSETTAYVVVLACYGAAFAAALLAALVLRAERPLPPALGALWLVPALPLLAEVHGHFGLRGLGALILLSKIGDIAAYYAGNAFGRHHPFKRLSPGKTTEGCAASFVAGAAFGPVCTAIGLFPEGTDIWSAVAAGALVNLASQSGDLLESWVKRRADVKDSSTWLGPSGGILDVCDSLLVSVPVALIAWPHLVPTISP